MRSNSWKNMSMDPDKADEPEEITDELMKKLQEQMRKYELLKKAVDFRVREGLVDVPLVEVLPVRRTLRQTSGEGAQD